MKETFKKFYSRLKNEFNNIVYIKDINENEPIDFSVRDIKIEKNSLYLDGKKINLNNLSDNIIIVYGSVEKLENCKNVFVIGDTYSINNSENVNCGDVEGNIICTALKAENISSNVINSENIECADVEGSIRANGNVKCENVSENIVSNSDVTIQGDVGGNLDAFNIFLKGNIEGNVICRGNLSHVGDIFGNVYESIKDKV